MEPNIVFNVELEFLPRDSAAARLRESKKMHYVYVLADSDSKPFYVGKGVGNRVFQHEAEARGKILKTHKLNLIRKLHREGRQILYAFAGFFSDEVAALAEEQRLIVSIGRYDLKRGPLTNQTDGGEGTSNPSEESRQRRLATLGGESEDPERRVINEFFAGIGGAQSSVPIKPAASWRDARPLRWTDRTYGPTARSARAIVATAAANGILLFPGVVLPRLLVVNGVEYLIENGCGDALIKSRMVEFIPNGDHPREEKFSLTRAGFEYVCEIIGGAKLVDLGVLEP